MTTETYKALPPEGDLDLAGVQLPAGRLIRPEPTGLRRIGRTPEPALWLSAEFDDAPAAWLALTDRLDGSGLVPLLLTALEGQPDRPWVAGELAPGDPDVVDGLELTGVFAELWDGGVPDQDEDPEETTELLAPFGRKLPGLAPGTSRLADAGELAAATATVDLPAGIGLVRAGRPADALVAAGWPGAANILDSPAPRRQHHPGPGQHRRLRRGTPGRHDLVVLVGLTASERAQATPGAGTPHRSAIVSPAACTGMAQVCRPTTPSAVTAACC